MVRIHNVDTDEIIDREMNNEEFAQWQIDVQADKDRLEAIEKAATDKAALLIKLGITPDEAKLLLAPEAQKPIG
jgi:hypothetical protein